MSVTKFESVHGRACRLFRLCRLCRSCRFCRFCRLCNVRRRGGYGGLPVFLNPSALFARTTRMHTYRAMRGSDAKAIARVVLKLFHTSCVRTGWYSETLTDTHSAIRVTHARACVHARPYARTHANAHAPIPTHGHGFFCIRGRAAAGTWVVILCARHRWGVASTRAWFTSQARKITTLNDRALIQNASYQLLQTLPHRRMISGQTTSQQPIWLVRLYQNLKRSHRHFVCFGQLERRTLI